MTATRAVSGNVIPAYAKTAGRAVHIRIHPQPQNIAESREVLRILQRYGEVTMYKHLKHEPNLHAANTALAIFQNVNSAQDAINASPLRFKIRNKMDTSFHTQHQGSIQIPEGDEMEEQSPADDGLHSETSDARPPWMKSFAKGRSTMREAAAGTTSSSIPYIGLGGNCRNTSSQYAQATSVPTSVPKPPRPFTSNPTPSSSNSTSLPYPPSPPSSPSSLPNATESTKAFHLMITRSTLNHYAYIQRQHYYGGFRVDRLNTMAEDLEARVPVKGMMDCQLTKGEAPLRMRIKRRETQEAQNAPRRTLREVWEEGKKNRGESIT